MKYVIFVLVFVAIINVFFVFANDVNKERKKFTPTHEWQEIGEDDILPANLHYRINLKTGLKEAKLLDSESIRDSNAVAESFESKSDDELNINDNGVKQIDYQEVKERVKEIKQRFRSIEQLKKEFEALNINPKSETQVVHELLKQYNKSTASQKANILDDIEFHVHQVDVALDFAKMGGFEALLPDLNSSDASLRALVALTLGSAMQNNVKVQIAAMKSNALDPLLRVISMDSSSIVKSRALYAVSCLIRQFPFAQKSFIRKGGISVLARLFQENNLIVDKLKIKVINLLHDILLEQKDARNSVIDEISKERHQQYEEVKLIGNLQSSGFCELIPLMLNHTESEIKVQVLNLMDLLFDVCFDRFEATLKSMSLSSDSEHFDELQNLRDNLLNRIHLKNKIEL